MRRGPASSALPVAANAGNREQRFAPGCRRTVAPPMLGATPPERAVTLSVAQIPSLARPNRLTAACAVHQTCLNPWPQHVPQPHVIGVVPPAVFGVRERHAGRVIPGTRRS
jgi:hypothetical protein